MKHRYISRPFHKPDYCIQTDDETLILHLELQYGQYMSELGSVHSSIITVVKQANDQYLLSYQNQETVTSTPLFAIDIIISEQTQYDDAIFALHGAAVEWQGKAYLFLAPTMSGKSTLTAYLLNRGFGYITDDCILLDRNHFTVHPFHCPLHLRNGGVDVLRSKNIYIPCTQSVIDTQRQVYTPTNLVEQPIPLGQIYFIERNDVQNQWNELSTNNAMVKLLQAPMIPYQLTGDYLRFIAKLTATKCKHLLFKDIEFVEDSIKRQNEESL